MTETEIVLAINAMPLGQRLAFVADWADGMGELRTFTPTDPLRDIYTMQRALLSALVIADGMGFGIQSTNFVDPSKDPLGAIDQVKAIAASLLNSPDFQAATGGVAITVH
jgi:hypothetical protein